MTREIAFFRSLSTCRLCRQTSIGASLACLLASARAPFLIDFSGNLFRVCVLSRSALADRSELALEWRNYRRPVMTVAVLGPLGYLLVLFALRSAPISHVAPARELATLVGTWFGARLLGEQAAAQRVAGALCIVAGVISLALSG